MRLEMVASDSPKNGRLPAAISSTITPSEKISERPSTKKCKWKSGSAGLVFSTVVTLLVLPMMCVLMATPVGMICGIG